jgi:hypothetical protein
MTAEQAVEQYRALVELEKVTGSKTTRARNEVVRSLEDAELIRFAVILKKDGDLNVNPTR